MRNFFFECSPPMCVDPSFYFGISKKYNYEKTRSSLRLDQTQMCVISFSEISEKLRKLESKNKTMKMPFLRGSQKYL